MIVSQELCWEVRSPCCGSPIYLIWASSQTAEVHTNDYLGWWDTWLFECKWIKSLVTDTVTEIDVFGSDIATQQAFTAVLRKEAKAQIKAIATLLTKQQMMGLSTLLTSSRVYLWLGNDPNVVLPTDLLEVKIESGTFEIDDQNKTRQKCLITLSYDLQTVVR